MEDKSFGLVVGILSLACLGVMPMAYPNTSFENSCPDTFVGKVQQVQDEKGPNGPLKKVRVEFRELGDKGGKREIKALKHGENNFQKGDTYRIGMRSGYLCEVTKIAGTSN